MSILSNLSFFHLVFISTIIVFVGFGIEMGAFYLKPFGNYTIDWAEKSNLNDLSSKEKALFLKFDANQDFVIGPREFQKFLRHFLSHDDEPTVAVDSDDYDPESDEVLQLEAKMKPLDLLSMTQKNKDANFGLPGFLYSKEFDGLLSWKDVNMRNCEFMAKEFNGFLPPSYFQVVGKPYWIISKRNSEEILEKNPYKPPDPANGIEKVIQKILKMLHPRPFLKLRFSPGGGVAVVRSKNNVYFDVVFRLHSEFQLNEKPQLPYWFTPSQFSGHMIISKDGNHVREFSLRVPNHVKLNVDMEWMYKGMEEDGNHMEVDIGYIPLLEVKQLKPSSPVVLDSGDGAIIDRRELWKHGEDVQIEFDHIVWDEEITLKEAQKLLEVQFYPFKKVEYFSFSEAFRRSEIEKKLVHQVVLWGSLDDQSC